MQVGRDTQSRGAANMKILIAEDDPGYRLMLGMRLRNLGHDVVAAENGREAWEVFQKESVPLLIADWKMPFLDGLELCRLIRAENRPRYTYIILLTALSGKGAYLEGMDAGADDFVTKPINSDELAARLRVAERILSLQRELKQLETLLPICMYCKKIRDENNAWTQVEQYIAKRTDTSFSHGVCPDCYQTIVKPELDRWKKKRM